ncbi:MAG: MoaD/ThiS family protein [Acidobacteriaceae bacterium]|nr:MoaD/ThiS family protein [Acidobacteriaceae bacterium]
MKIHIPTPLRAYTDKQETVSVAGATVAEGLDELTKAFPAMRAHLFTPDGKLRSFVNVYLDDEDVRYLPAKEATAVAPEAELTIIPSIAGGCCSLPAAGCCRS